MRRKLITILLTASLFMTFTLPASAWVSNETWTDGRSIVWNPSGTVYCPVGSTWQINMYSHAFGAGDSTGTQRITFTVSGVDRYVSRTGEMDGTTYRWHTPWRGLTYISGKINNVYPLGRFNLSAQCKV